MRSPLLIEIPEEIDGTRVHLRPHRPEDITQVWEAIQESRGHLEPWLPWVHPGLSLDDERIFMVQTRVRWLLREELAMAIFERDSDRYLGGVGMQQVPGLHQVSFGAESSAAADRTRLSSSCKLVSSSSESAESTDSI